MPRATPASWLAEVDRIHGTTPLAWLFEIPLHVSASLHVRAAITPHPTPIVFSGAVTYLPWACKLSALEEDLDSSIPQMSLQVSNHGRFAMRYLMPTDRSVGPVGRMLEARLVKLDDLANPWLFTWRIAAAAADDKSVTFRLEPPNWFELDVPQDRFQQGLCRLRFGQQSSGCPYVVNASAAFRDCPGTLAACTARGDDMVVRGLPRLLPQLWGGFSGMARQ